MSSEKNKIEVCFSPALFDRYESTNHIVVVIDVLRATSSICVAFHHGVKSIVPVSVIEDCMAYKAKGYLVAAERGGEMVQGFDFGNSPFSYMGETIKNKSVAITTTNGTQAINIAKNSNQVVIGSFLNLDAITNWLSKQNKGVTCVCAGWKNKFNLEDSLCAGAITEALTRTGKFITECDSALASAHLYSLAKNDLYGFLSNSSHRRRLEKLGIDKDVRFCLTPNQTTVIPVLEGDALVSMKLPIPA